MKSRRKIPAQDPSGRNQATMISMQLLLLPYHLPARGIFHISLQWRCWCVYQYQDYRHITLAYYHPWNRYSVPLPVTGKLHNRSKLSAAQILYFPCSVFGSCRLNVKCTYTGLVPIHSPRSWSFLPKAKELEGGEIVFVGFMVVGFLYIAFAVAKLAD